MILSPAEFPGLWTVLCSPKRLCDPANIGIHHANIAGCLCASWPKGICAKPPNHGNARLTGNLLRQPRIQDVLCKHCRNTLGPNLANDLSHTLC